MVALILQHLALIIINKLIILWSVLFWFFGPNSVDVCACISLVLNIQVFLLELEDLFLGLMISLHVNVFRVRINVCEIQGLNLLCIFTLTALYSVWDSIGGWWVCTSTRVEMPPAPLLQGISVLYPSWLHPCSAILQACLLFLKHFGGTRAVSPLCSHRCLFQLMPVQQVICRLEQEQNILQSLSCWALC